MGPTGQELYERFGKATGATTEAQDRKEIHTWLSTDTFTLDDLTELCRFLNCGIGDLASVIARRRRDEQGLDSKRSKNGRAGRATTSNAG